MNPFAPTLATVTMDKMLDWLAKLKTVMELQNLYDAEWEVDDIAAEFAALEDAGDADLGNDVYYGRVEGRDVRRMAALADATRAFWLEPVNIDMADGTTESTFISHLVARFWPRLGA